MSQVTITRLAVVGATCEACSDAAVVSSRVDRDVRYYCRKHITYALRTVGAHVRV